jgi:hypothetical protein
MKQIKKWMVRVLLFLIAVYLLLLIPDSKEDHTLVMAGKRPFVWNRDAQWQQLEEKFNAAKQLPPAIIDSSIDGLKRVAEADFKVFDQPEFFVGSADSILTDLENNFFNLAPLVAVKTAHLPWFITYYNQVRNEVKQRSRQWNMNEPEKRNTVYTLLYGMRAAVEEVILQTDTSKLSPIMLVKEERSVTPVTHIFGIEVHSGDLLVSRGGAEVSALISRGNDYPGNFSHVALVYVDENTSQAYLIEAHIERGVAVSSVDQYEQDKKLRFMVMRPRADLPQMQKDPMLPQKAARLMFEEANRRHIPYDFKMNFHDSSVMFCSEVCSYAYRKQGVQLWQPVSTISSQGVINWLHDFGVENFVTQMPSDLEYDPQLTVVAEWRDPGTLFKDHIDNAVMDVLLERADAGETIPYNNWKLPIVRVVKAYCTILNWFGKTGIIPEGMNATRALKNQSFVSRYVKLKEQTLQLADKFMQQKGYRPPYWQLVNMARLAVQRPN